TWWRSAAACRSAASPASISRRSSEPPPSSASTASYWFLSPPIFSSFAATEYEKPLIGAGIRRRHGSRDKQCERSGIPAIHWQSVNARQLDNLAQGRCRSIYGRRNGLHCHFFSNCND